MRRLQCGRPEERRPPAAPPMVRFVLLAAAAGGLLWAAAAEPDSPMTTSTPATGPSSPLSIQQLQTLMDKLRPLYARLGEPEPGDWLYHHKEPGQTFRQYVASDPVRPVGKRTVIYIQPYIMLIHHYPVSFWVGTLVYPRRASPNFIAYIRVPHKHKSPCLFGFIFYPLIHDRPVLHGR